MQVLVTTARAWHLRQTARAFSKRGALGGFWMADKNDGAVPERQYRRCWPYHLAMKFFYHCASQIWEEKATYRFIPLYEGWLRRQFENASIPRRSRGNEAQNTHPTAGHQDQSLVTSAATSSQAMAFQVVQTIMGLGTELFRQAEKIGALKVLDCTNSHPTMYRECWQRECDLWCPGEKVPVPGFAFERMKREIDAADLVLCPSQFVYDSMVRNGVASQKCFINPFGVDTSKFTPRQSVPSAPRFICVGTICLRKGHQYLFRAFEQVKKTLPNAELICAGEFKADFRCERPKWEGTFQHYSKLSHEKLNEIMKSCTAFVLPSCEEGLARVIPEAMAAGLPVIATYESGATTLVRDGVEGFIVSPKPEDIARAMVRVTQERELGARMGAAAHERGAVSNGWLDYGGRLLAEYRRRLEARGAAR
jgi:glycosyltransferase involved in cell wall biosynthesis